MPDTPLPPVAARRPLLRRLHGDEFVDHYEWLRDKDSAEVTTYLEAENSYTAARTAHLAELTHELFEEVRHRTQETDQSVPDYVEHTSGRAYWYYSRTLAGSSYPIHCRALATDRDRRPDLSGEVPAEEVLLDCNEAAADQEFFSLGGFEVSPNGERLAYLVDTSGDERFRLVVKDLSTGELLPDAASDLGYTLCWAGDDWLFYGRVDEAWRPHQVWRHRIGDAAQSDQVVLEEADEMFWLQAWASRDDSTVLFYSGSKLTAEWHVLPTADPAGSPRCVAPRSAGLDYWVEPAGDRLLILHNAACADYELAEAPLEATSATEWSTVLAGEAGVRLETVDAYADLVLVSLRRAGIRTVHVLPRVDGRPQPGHDVPFPDELFEAAPIAGANYRADRVRIRYSGLVTPDIDFEYRFPTGELVVLKQEIVRDDPERGEFRPADYVVRREWATASDGTRVPISLFHRAGLALDGTAPCYLYGYGAYESSVPIDFRMFRLLLAERGFVVAIAHVRGGGELGRRWYEEGRMLAKPTTFTDFIACARQLVQAGYTVPERLVADGRSAGGLLMGAVVNLAPDLFRAVHAGVPFVDALTTMTKPELPLTVAEWEEWGDPVGDAAVYTTMKGYTPYENIRPVRYPAILATTSFNDTRVQYVEPAKWVAQLRHTLPDSADILLRTEMAAGHGGVSGRYDRWRQQAFEYGWLLAAVEGSS